MENKNHKKMKKTLDYLIITTAYTLTVGLLIFLSLKFKELPGIYFSISIVVIMVWNKVIPRDKYLNTIRYISNFIYALYGLYGIYEIYGIVFELFN